MLCKDRSKYCKEWANDGRCDTDRWVYNNCMLSCKRFTICDQEIIKPIGKHLKHDYYFIENISRVLVG